jgi:6-phosphogluconolactonase
VEFAWQAFEDARAAAEACAAHAGEVLETALGAGDEATLALSGGSTPAIMFQRLAVSGLPWDRIHLFWVDERAVPPTDPESNFRLAAGTLLGPARVPQANIHRVRAELAPQAAARAYEEEIRRHFGLAPGETPEFDLVHRGMGPDMHTASLFPGDPLIGDREGLVAAVWSAPRSQWRITLLPRALVAARHTVMLVTGADKAEGVRAVFEEPCDPSLRPAQLSPPHGRGVVWFLDRAAARLL